MPGDLECRICHMYGTYSSYVSNVFIENVTKDLIWFHCNQIFLKMKNFKRDKEARFSIVYTDQLKLQNFTTNLLLL